MEALRFGRRFFAPDALLALAELVAVVSPPLFFFGITAEQRSTALAATPIVLGLASLVWFFAVRAWRAPIGRATKRRLAGEVLDAAARSDAYRAIRMFPRQALLLRVTLWTASGLAVSGLMVVRANFPVGAALTVVMVAASHAFAVNIFRALWYRRLLEHVRAALLPDLDSLQRFADSYRESLVLGALATGALGVVAVATFTYFFIPINLEQYVKLETWFPGTVALLTLAWCGFGSAVSAVPSTPISTPRSRPKRRRSRLATTRAPSPPIAPHSRFPIC